MGFCNCSLFCCTFLYVHSSFAIILMGKRELVALLSLSSWCLVIVVWLFLAVPWICLQFVIVVFPDHTNNLQPLFTFSMRTRIHSPISSLSRISLSVVIIQEMKGKLPSTCICFHILKVSRVQRSGIDTIKYHT